MGDDILPLPEPSVRHNDPEVRRSLMLEMKVQQEDGSLKDEPPDGLSFLDHGLIGFDILRNLSYGYPETLADEDVEPDFETPASR